MIVLFLLFLIIPAVDLWLLVRLGGEIGGWNTVALTILISMVGASLARRQGARVLQELALSAQQGVPPAGKLLEGALVLAGGLLLLTPGLITDTIGLVLLFPPTRRLLAPLIGAWLIGRVMSSGFVVRVGPGAFDGQDPLGPGPGPRSGGGPRPPPGDHRPPPSRNSPFDHPTV